MSEIGEGGGSGGTSFSSPEAFRSYQWIDERLAKLPRWAIAAFAFRCVKEMPPATDASVEQWRNAVLKTAANAILSGFALMSKSTVPSINNEHDGCIAGGVLALTDAIRSSETSAVRRLALEVVKKLLQVGNDHRVSACMSYLQWLHSEAMRLHWDDQTLIPPLHLNGPGGATSNQPIDIFLDPGEASEETLQEVLDALSEVNIAYGGLGLEFTLDDNLVLKAAEVEP